jgi:asparagine synthase (glutamine-hydrolysing)
VHSGYAGRAASLLDPAFARDTDLDERITQWSAGYRRATGSETALHLWNMSSPAVARAFETLHRAGDQVGVELRFPFYDRRLVTYALAIPDREKLRDGWPRSVLRRAMEGILPPKVQWRRSKIDFGPELVVGLVHHHGDLLHEVLRDHAAVGEYVDLGMARRHVKALLAAPEAANPLDLFALWRVVFLALWLNNRSAALRPEKVLS